MQDEKQLFAGFRECIYVRWQIDRPIKRSKSNAIEIWIEKNLKIIKGRHLKHHSQVDI